MELNEIITNLFALVEAAEQEKKETVEIPVDAAQAIYDYLRIATEDPTPEEIFNEFDQLKDGADAETLEKLNKVEPLLLQIKEILQTDTNEESAPGDNPDFEPTKEAEKENPLDPKTIAEVLNSKDRQKATEDSAQYRKVLPQVEVDAVDVEKALKEVNGVSSDYLNEPGFMTHVYKNAAKRTNVDISKCDKGLFVKFVNK